MKQIHQEQIYDQVIYAGPPPLPPERIQTQDNPAYVKVELTDCIAYEKGLQLPDNPSPQRHPTTHQVEDEQNELERDTVNSVMNKLQQYVEDTVVFETPV